MKVSLGKESALKWLSLLTGIVYSAAAVIIVGFLAIFLYFQYQVVKGTEESYTLVQRLGDVSDDAERRYSQIEAALSDFQEILQETKDISKVTLGQAALYEQVERQEERVAAIERTLDLQPRELIEILSLKSEIENLRSDVDGAVAQIQRENERNFSLVTSLLTALLVAIGLMFLGAVLRTRIS